MVAASNGFGITTPGGTVIDLDGTTGPGTLTSLASYTFNAGDVVSLSFLLGGAQPGSTLDVVIASVSFAALSNISSIAGVGYLAAGPIGPFSMLMGFSRNIGLAGTDSFLPSGLTFTAGGPGSFTFSIGTNSADNVGPLLASVLVDITPTAVPAPAAGGLMLLGLGLMALARRRRLV